MKRILTRNVVILTLVLASLLLCGTLTYILVRRPAARPGPAPFSAALTVIPAPSSTPPYLPPTPTALPPTPLPSPTPAPGQFALGVYVQITGTGSDGLRIHADAGEQTPTLFVGKDTEVYQITKGPKNVGDYTWWFLTAPYDQTRSGWAAQKYLSVLQSP